MHNKDHSNEPDDLFLMMEATDYFELFQLPRAFDIDLGVLASRYRAVQAEVHPDKHAAASGQQRLVAMQYSTRANDAYQCLKSPLSRAAYLLELAGHSCDFDNHTIADAGFLMQQMELREELADSPDIDAVERFADGLEEMLEREQAKFVSAYSDQDYQSARDCVSRLHFLYKLREEAQAKLEALDLE